MNDCRTCRNPGHIEDLGQWYCRSCFRGMIESRIKRSIFQRFRREDRVFIPNAWSGAVLQRLLGWFPLQLVNNPRLADKVVNPASADDLAQGFIQQLSGSGVQPTDEREVLLFSSVTDQELVQYCSLMGIPCTPQPKDQQMQQFFQQLKKYPDIPLNMSRTTREIQRLHEMTKHPRVVLEHPQNSTGEHTSGISVVSKNVRALQKIDFPS